MGIATGTFQLLLQEHRLRPFSGRVLTLGKQDIFLTSADVEYWTDYYGVPRSVPEVVVPPVKANHVAKGHLPDKTLFATLGTEVTSLDASNYEGCDHDADLNDPEPPESLRGRFDVVLDTGTFEHAFHIPNAIRFCHALLREGGRMIHMSPTSNHVDHGFYMLSPTLFHDFYRANAERVEERLTRFMNWIRASAGRRSDVRIAVYGAGGHTRILLRVWRRLGLPEPAVVLQSSAPAEGSFEGLALRSVNDVHEVERPPLVVLFSHSHEAVMAETCAAKFSQAAVLRIRSKPIRAGMPAQPPMPVCVGIDFDNTLVCYDAVFARVAAEQGLPGVEAGTARRLLRERSRKTGEGELAWTRIQGEAYGPGMREARPFAGAVDAIRGWLDRGWRVVVISHRTRFPAVGPAHDLHQCARAWLDRWLGDGRVTAFFETTRWAKLRRIESQRCTVFVDDLLEVLEDPAFPSCTHAVHFSPDVGGVDVRETGMTKASSWAQLPGVVARLSTSCVEKTSGENESARLDPFPSEPHSRLDELVARALHTRIAETEWLVGGINNLCARLRLDDGRTIVGKCYRRSPDDPRDRFRHETSFLQVLERVGIDCVPRILAVDEVNGISLQTCLSGKPFPEADMAPPEVWRQFDAFLERLQGESVRQAAKDLPHAAEAGFTLQDHLGWLQQRRDLWRARALAGELPPELTELITGELEDAYARVACATISHPEFKGRIDKSRLILTPSDFGLHNALVDDSGRVLFVDFEYSGWDDPAKTEIDFCRQPRHSAGRPGQLRCLDARLDRSSDRHRVLRELLGLKWRYIVLAAELSGSIARSPCSRCPVQQ